MLGMLERLLPREVLELALVLFLSFLVGIDREEHKARVGHYVFGGIRTFPLLGFIGYGLGRLSGGNVLALAIGFGVIGGLLAISYWHKVRVESTAGATTELSGLLTYLVGALVYVGAYWMAVALGVIAVLLLELREGLERLTARLGRDEVVAFTKFLVLAIVILPVLPDRSFTRFEINPFRTWLVLVAVSGLSYASYASQKWLKERGGVLLTALLGGAYSSTATTVVLARQAKSAGAPRLYAGSMLAASGVMYARMILLVLLFDAHLAATLAPGFCALALVAIGAGILLALQPGPKSIGLTQPPPPTKNPLELGPAFLFGGAFLVVLVLSRLAVDSVGRAGLYGLAALLGLTDVDPFVLGLAQSGRSELLHVAGIAIVIAAASNNVAKGAYAYAFADRTTGRMTLVLLGALAALGLLPIVWL
jgi:uncharacterized membrane protein (DUF4010 family)